MYFTLSIHLCILTGRSLEIDNIYYYNTVNAIYIYIYELKNRILCLLVHTNNFVYIHQEIVLTFSGQNRTILIMKVNVTVPTV